MTCAHHRVPGYAFCGDCGEPTELPVCRCGFVAAASDRFCGRCGQSMAAEARGSLPDTGITASHPGGRLDLARLMAEAGQDKELISAESGGHVTQDDIRALIAARRGKR